MVNYNHHGHAVSQKVFETLYPKNRQISESTMEFVKKALPLKPNSYCFKQEVRQQNPGVEILDKDYQNLVQKAKKELLEEGDKALYEIIHGQKEIFLKTEGNVFEIKKSNNLLDFILIMTKESKELFAKNHDVLLIDGTHRTNSHRHPLYIFMAQDALGIGRVVGFAFVRNETTEMLTNLFYAFLKNVPYEVKTICIDKDMQEINALNQVFPNASIKLCLVHCLRSFWRATNQYKLSLNDKNNLGGIFRSMLFAQDLLYEKRVQGNGSQIDIPQQYNSSNFIDGDKGRTLDPDSLLSEGSSNFQKKCIKHWKDFNRAD